MLQALIRKSVIPAVFVLVIGCVDENSQQKENQSVQTRNSSFPEKGEKEKPLFERVSSEHSNIDFANQLTETEALNIINYHYFYNGGGVACGDINNDGLQDLYFTANQLPDKLYLNKGNMQFEDISHHLPPHREDSWTTGVSMADVNGDGLMDIYVCRSGRLPSEDRRNSLLINQGDLSFVDKSSDYGLDDPGYSTQAAFFDYDKDGDLDMYLLNHEIEDISNYNRQIRASGRDPYVGDKLYRNDGDKFVEVGEAAGIIANPYGFGLGVAIGDLNNDNWPDIYVTNDFLENDFLYINNKNGSFTESIQSATKHISNYGMGVDISDINNDGLQDILVVDMVAKDNFRQKTNMSGMNPEKFWQCIEFGFHYQYMYNSLQLNQGGEKFSEVGQMAGVSNTDWSWAALMVDLDYDGAKDIFITNGLRKDVRNNDFVKNHILYAEQMPKNAGLSSEEILRNQLINMPSQKVANYVFKNKGELRFEDKSQDWGMGMPSFSTGAAYADLDNDGDLDLVINNVDEEAYLFANTNSENKANNYLGVQLKGPGKNRFGIGAKLRLSTTDTEQHQEIYQTRGYQSSVPPVAYFGLGNSESVESLEVIWPDGKQTRIEKPAINQLISLVYEDAEINTLKPKAPEIRFREVTEEFGIDFSHRENPYDDFQDQVLLPHKLSTLGPALAVGDIDGDGLEDFVVGGAHGFAAEIYRQSPDGKFRKKKASFLEKHRHFEDVDALLFDADGDQDLDLYIASGGYEFDINSADLQDRLYLNDGKGNFIYAENALPEFRVSSGCVKPYDFDSDGDMDLFVGGRMRPKNYPLPPKSFLLENDKGIFKDVTRKKMPQVQEAGMVTDAEWMDIDQDGQVDLVVAGEWMPITIFKGKAGKFELMDAKSNALGNSNGWWYSLQQIDFDQDGDMDFLAGNLGLNYKFKASEEKPFKVFGEDFDNNESVDVVLSYSQEGVYYPVRGRECSSQQMPFIKEKFPDYGSFARASVYDVLGSDNIQNSIAYNSYTFATTLFENKDGRFEAIPLDHRLQLSSINDFVVTDLNKDGFSDVIMAGNLYGSEVETPRNDAGYGNILLGNGTTSFDLISPVQSSFFGEGDVKKIRVIKTANGSSLYLVAQNSGSLRAFRYE